MQSLGSVIREAQNPELFPCAAEMLMRFGGQEPCWYEVSLYLDDDLWKRFKRNVLRKTGNLRSLSSEVQSLIKENSDEDSIQKGLEKMGIDAKPISSSQVVPVRPTAKTTSAKTIRKMRDRRYFGSRKDL